MNPWIIFSLGIIAGIGISCTLIRWILVQHYEKEILRIQDKFSHEQQEWKDQHLADYQAAFSQLHEEYIKLQTERLRLTEQASALESEDKIKEKLVSETLSRIYSSIERKYFLKQK